MSSDKWAIKVNNLGKFYEIYKFPHHRLFQTLCRGKKQFCEKFWALREVSFQVERGQCVGIVGRNGSGKSTLLQIIAGTLAQSEGDVVVSGRISALLELGSGFNPEFTGRENVYMNGSVLGLRRAEIDEKFKPIVDFADIGDFIDQPVKTYSSGMLMRLAFAVQTQVQPEILIIDEALAVGDAAFQMKCMAYMKSLMERGVTILLVSHSVQTIRSFCDKAVWIHQGRLKMVDVASEVTGKYMEFLFSGGSQQSEEARGLGDEARSPVEVSLPLADLTLLNHPSRKDPLRRWGSGEIQIKRFSISGEKSGTSYCFEHNEKMQIKFEAQVFRDFPYNEISVAFSIRDIRGIDLISISSSERGCYVENLKEKSFFYASFEFKNIINPGEYAVVLAVEYFENNERHYCDYVENAAMIQIVSDMKHFGLVEPSTHIEVFYS